ncbi:ribonuclease P protein subunit p40 [Amia ocellicauda]|uniref:ribonuclease P protein subunit p40 n=1 Tax=Amia ocellicauda TaxID=2972642 RepID=UPI003464014B
MFANLEKCPRHLVVCEKSNFTNDKSRHGTHVAGHYFNYKVSILIPECGSLPSALQSIVNGFTKYYLVRDFPVFEMLEEEFLERHVKKGSLYALSYRTRIDQDNTIALLPTGTLVLSVDKDTYEALGLEGQKSQYNHKMRYVICIDLTDKSLAPGSKKYKRVLWALKEKVQLRSDFLMAKHDNAGNKSEPLSSCFTQYQCKEYAPTVSTRRLTDTLCPVINSRHLRGEAEESCDSQEFLEWLGAVTAGVIDCNNKASSFLSTYCCPEPRTALGQACLSSVTGFLLPEDIHKLLAELRCYFDEPKFASWSSLTVHGFADSPVSWGTAEHGFHKGGENLYSFVIFKNQDYWLHMVAGAHDGCPP